jgi:uroporphyrinogen III methyltransferase/synthase
VTKGKVFIVGAGPGDPKLLTLRALEIVRIADVVMYDRLVGEEILRLVPQHASKIYVGKTPQRHVVPQEVINELLISKAKMGKNVVRLKGGDPFIFARGGEEVQALRAAKIDFEIVPGISSAFAAPAYAGIPLTHRNYSSSVAVVTGHQDQSKKEPTIKWAQLASCVDTIVILMGVATFKEIAGELIAGGLSPETPVAAIEWATTKRQKIIAFELGEAANGEISGFLKSPSVIVVGKVASLRGELVWSHKEELSATDITNQPEPSESRFHDMGRCIMEEGLNGFDRAKLMKLKAFHDVLTLTWNRTRSVRLRLDR